MTDYTAIKTFFTIARISMVLGILGSTAFGILTAQTNFLHGAIIVIGGIIASILTNVGAEIAMAVAEIAENTRKKEGKEALKTIKKSKVTKKEEYQVDANGKTLVGPTGRPVLKQTNG